MQPTILVIEDNAEIAENICSILELDHYKVLSAANGKIGVEMAKEHLPDLILCDIMMPELDGYGVAHILHRDQETANIPFIFLTAKTDLGDFRTGMDLGADDYITKPFDGMHLLKVVDLRLKKNQQLKSIAEVIEPENTFGHDEKNPLALKKLMEGRTSRLLKRKEFLFLEGQSPNDLYYLEEGKIKTYKINYDGKELITGIYHPGEFIGYVALLEDKAYGESAEVTEDARVLIIPKTDFLSLLYSNKGIARKFIKLLSNNLEETEVRLLNLAYNSVRQRVAATLLKLNAEETTKGIIIMGRKDIANIVGTATESLNRTLADFKDEGIVDILPEGLRVTNQAKLEKLTR
jgi:CRP-like cAMP-binding protein/CheY-like chemotaxis protein